LLVEGRLKYDTWDDKQGGGKRSKHAIVIENFQLLGGRDAGGGGGGGAGRSPDETSQDDSRPQRPQGRPANGRSTQPPPQEPPFPEDQQFQDDDIPF
jgi:single-strand DNA-binding protein